MMVRALLILCFVAACLFGTERAFAGVTRFAVVIGNNTGAKGDAPLRYAEADAQKPPRQQGARASPLPVHSPGRSRESGYQKKLWITSTTWPV